MNDSGDGRRPPPPRREWRGTTISVRPLTWGYAVLTVQRPGCAPVSLSRTADGLDDFLDRFERGEERAWLEEITTRRTAARPRRSSWRRSS